MAAEDNVAIVRRHCDLINAGKLEEAFKLVDENIRIHTRGQSMNGRDLLLKMMQMAQMTFSEYKESVDDIFGSGDRVCIRGVRSGRHTKQFGQMPPTGNLVETTFMVICRLEKGKIVERWMNHDDLGFLQGMGVLNGPPQGGNHGHSHGDESNSQHGHSHGPGGTCGGHGHGGSSAPTVTGKNFPSNPETLTAGWLTEILKKNALISSKVVSVSKDNREKQPSVSSNVAHLTLAYEKPEMGVPKNMVARFATANQMARPIFKTAKTHLRTVRFHDQMAQRCSGIHTPRTFVSGYDPASDDFILITEDPATDCTKGDVSKPVAVDSAKSIVNSLAQFHSQWWIYQETTNPNILWLASAPASELIYFQTYKASWPFFKNNFGDVPSTIVKIGDRLVEELNHLFTYARAQVPMTLCHNDFNIGSLYLDKSGKVFVDSWSEVSLGRGVRDVSSFMAVSLEPEDRKSCEEELLRQYHAVLMEKGVTGYKFQKCFYDYKLLMLLTFVKNVCNGAGLFVLEKQGKLENSQKATLQEYKLIFRRILAALEELNVYSLLEDFRRR